MVSLADSACGGPAGGFAMKINMDNEYPTRPAADLGATNGGLTHTPNIDALRNEGLVLSSYHTFKICSPSRASMFTGRYPWGAGFYDSQW